jgi:mannose-1-phosphate guanylyltransferase/mannose-6-phosphate isomerase
MLGAGGASKVDRTPMPKIYPVILSGGSGTRLWPLSRARYPKQFIRFFDHQSASFLQATATRLGGAEGFEAPTLLANNDHRFLVSEQLEAAGVTPRAIILEPAARNTAPAIAVAALSALQEDEDAVLAVMPSDHVIGDEPAFVEAVRRAAAIAATGKLVLFGITPNAPETGYGYIKAGAALEADNTQAFEVAQFYEKPDAATAQKYIAQGNAYWNSGVFVLPARVFLDELAAHEPDIVEAALSALYNAETDMGFLRLDEKAFAKSPSMAVDVAVMERTDKAVMLTLDVEWSDVGAWSSLMEVGTPDDQGNVVTGQAILEDTKNCFVHAERSLISTIGIEDLIVVETPDAILVSDAKRSQDVSKVVKRIRESNRSEHDRHVRSYRPWGYFETLNAGDRFQVKLLNVKPGATLSLQMHHHRSEHWVVVRGTAKVSCDDQTRLVRENESFYIQATQWHRLENPGKVPLQIIEVQLGSYLGEDDIVREHDIYNRSAEEVH